MFLLAMRPVILARVPTGLGLSELYAIPAFRLYALVALLLILKMFAVAFYVAALRVRRKVFSAPEDYETFDAAPRATADEEIERARRAHLNDLENILPFLAAGLLYALTAPSMGVARVYFWGFLLARVFHTVAYIGGLQPHRTIAYAVGIVLTIAMTIQTLVLVP